MLVRLGFSFQEVARGESRPAKGEPLVDGSPALAEPKVESEPDEAEPKCVCAVISDSIRVCHERGSDLSEPLGESCDHRVDEGLHRGVDCDGIPAMEEPA